MYFQERFLFKILSPNEYFIVRKLKRKPQPRTCQILSLISSQIRRNRLKGRGTMRTVDIFSSSAMMAAWCKVAVGRQMNFLASCFEDSQEANKCTEKEDKTSNFISGTILRGQWVEICWDHAGEKSLNWHFPPHKSERAARYFELPLFLLSLWLKSNLLLFELSLFHSLL